MRTQLKDEEQTGEIKSPSHTIKTGRNEFSIWNLGSEKTGLPTTLRVKNSQLPRGLGRLSDRKQTNDGLFSTNLYTSDTKHKIGK